MRTARPALEGLSASLDGGMNPILESYEGVLHCYFQSRLIEFRPVSRLSAATGRRTRYLQDLASRPSTRPVPPTRAALKRPE